MVTQPRAEETVSECCGLPRDEYGRCVHRPHHPTVRSDRLRLLIADVLASGGPLEDEMSAVDALLDALDDDGWEVVRRAY